MASFLRKIGKAIEKAVQDTGKTIEKAAHDAGKTLEKAAHDTGKTLEKAAHDTGNAIEKGAHDVGDFANEAGKAVGDFGRNFDRERLKGTENVFRELKIGYCRLIEGRSPEEGNDKNQNKVDDNFEKCMADENNFSIGISGDFEGNITGIQPPIPTTTGQKANIHLMTDEERKQVEAARLAEQKYILAFNNKIAEHFQPASTASAKFFEEVDTLELRPQGTTTALILNEIIEGGAYTSFTGEVFESKAAFLEYLTQDRMDDLKAMIDEVNKFDLSRGRLQLAEATLAFKGSFTLALDLLSGLLSAGQSATLIAIGTLDDVISGNDVSIGMLARAGKVPFFDTFATFSTLSVIQSDHYGATIEKRRAIRRLEDELVLLRARLEEIKKKRALEAK